MGVAAGVAGVVAGAAFLAYVFFYRTPDETPGLGFYPEDGALVQQRMETLEWPDDGASEWEARIHDESGSVVWFTRVKMPSVKLPYEVLQPSRHYGWSLQAIGKDVGDGAGMLVRRFRTPEMKRHETPAGEVTVFPAVLELSPRSMVGEVVLEVHHLGKLEVELPPELVFAGGLKSYDVSGPVLLHMRFDFARAARRVQDWGAVALKAGGVTVNVPVSGGDPVVSFREGVDTGFDPYQDTPSFSNFTLSFFSELTQGTCLGISLAVKLFFESVDFGSRDGVPVDDLHLPQLLEAVANSRRLVMDSSQSFREMSEKDPGRVMELMEALHLENLNPLNITATVKAVVTEEDEDRLASLLWRELARGSLPVVAGFRLRRKLVKTGEDVNSFALLDSGHAMLVYRAWRFGEETVFAVYDPNYEYRADEPLRTALWVRPGHAATYHAGLKPDRAMTRFATVTSSKVFGLTSLMLQKMKDWAVSTGEAFSDLLAPGGRGW